MVELVERFFVLFLLFPLFPSMSPLTQSRLFGMEMFQSKLEAGKTERQDFEQRVFVLIFTVFFHCVVNIDLSFGVFTFLFSSDTLKHFQKSNERCVFTARCVPCAILPHAGAFAPCASEHLPLQPARFGAFSATGAGSWWSRCGACCDPGKCS